MLLPILVAHAATLAWIAADRTAAGFTKNQATADIRRPDASGAGGRATPTPPVARAISMPVEPPAVTVLPIALAEPTVASDAALVAGDAT